MKTERLLQYYEQIADAPDAIARLRRFILDLAVRGKLVPQYPGEESASDLLKCIAAEKARLSKQGKLRNRPSLPFVADSDAPFSIPLTWKWVRFANIADFSAGRTPSRGDLAFWNTGDHAWVSIADLVDGQLLTSTKETVSAKARENIFRSPPEAVGTILMSFKLTIGKIARLGIPAFHNEAIIAIRPYFDELDPYLFLVLPLFARQGETKGAIKGATLNRDSISTILVPLPPLAEQHRIVAKIDELMALCDELEAARTEREAKRDHLAAASLARLNVPDAETFRDDARFALDALPELTARPDQVKQLRETILSLAVSGRLPTQSTDDEPIEDVVTRLQTGGAKGQQACEDASSLIVKPFDLPEGWKWLKIGCLVRSLKNDIRTGPFGSMLNKSEHKLSGVPVWGIESIDRRGGFTGRNKIFVDPKKASELASFKVGPGDIIMSRSGTVGELCRLPDGSPSGLISTNLMKLSLDSRIIISDYFCLLFKGAKSIDAQLKELCAGSTRVFLTQAILGKLSFPLPPLAEQERIVAKVDELMALCDELETSLTSADEARKKLLDALLAEALAPVDAGALQEAAE